MITRGIIRLLERTGKITERDRENDEGRRGRKRNRKGDERGCEMRVIRSEEEGRKKERKREGERRKEGKKRPSSSHAGELLLRDSHDRSAKMERQLIDRERRADDGRKKEQVEEEERKRTGWDHFLSLRAVHFVPRAKIIRRSDGAAAVLSMEFRFLGERLRNRSAIPRR